MVALYVGGRKVELADVERELAGAGRVEVRNDAGKVVGVVVPAPAARDDDPDWVKAITPEEIERRRKEGFLTFDQLKQRLGWE